MLRQQGPVFLQNSFHLTEKSPKSPQAKPSCDLNLPIGCTKDCCKGTFLV